MENIDIDKEVIETFDDFKKDYETFKKIYKQEGDNNNVFSLLNESVLRLYLAKRLITLIRDEIKIIAEKSYGKNNREKLDLQVTIKDNKLLNFELKIERDSQTVGCGIRDMIFDAIRLNENFEDSYNYVVIMIYPKFIVSNSQKNNKRIWSEDFFTLLKNKFLDNSQNIDVKEFKNEVVNCLQQDKKTKDKRWNEWFNMCEKSNVYLKFLGSYIIDEKESKIKCILYKVCSKNSNC